MFSIEYEDWKSICSQIFIQKRGRKRMYLQWYPFTRLTNQEKNIIISEEFFYQNIKTGLFLYFSENWLITDNYIMKGDGNFRNASLVSPILYLLLLCIGKTISKNYTSERPSGISAFYAGNFQENRLDYRKDYDVFFKTVNDFSQSYQYFIKTDIKDFFSNIDVNYLFETIDQRLVKTEHALSQKNLLMYKELLLCLGQGEFPLIENSTVSSYLSTVIYLEDTDIKLYKYVEEKETEISNFVMIRYVDDLYILFNSLTPENMFMPMVNRILNFYSSELKKSNLSLNRGKTSWKRVSELSDELKKSLYVEQVNGKEFDIIELVDKTLLLSFLQELQSELLNHRLDILKYTELIEKHFYLPNVEYTPQEIYNSLIYENHELFLGKEVIDILMSLVSFDYRFSKFDTKRLIVILLKTKDGALVRKLLSKLFEADKNGTWNIYDTSLAINYLLQRNFEHRDLLEILKHEETNVYQYHELFCKKSFLQSMNDPTQSYIHSFGQKGFSNNDDKLFFLYFMYNVELKKNNHLSTFAYYKNFFDRISAHLGLAINNDRVRKRPNYKAYYKENALKKLYENIPDSEIIIRKAHNIRNSNPLSHSSAELIDSSTTYEDILESINDLNYLIKRKIEEL